MSDEAREAVARALRNSVYGVERDDEWPTLNGRLKIQYFEEAEIILNALRPIIAAEIRAWAENETEWLERDEYNQPIRRVPTAFAALETLNLDADKIAERITKGGEQ